MAEDKSGISATPGIIKNLNDTQNKLNDSLISGDFLICLTCLQQIANELVSGITPADFTEFDTEIDELTELGKKAVSFNKSIGGSSFPLIRKQVRDRITRVNRDLLRVRNRLGLGIDVSRTKKLKR